MTAPTLRTSGATLPSLRCSPILLPTPRRPEEVAAAEPHAAGLALVRGGRSGFALVEEHGVFVVKPVELGSLDLLADEPLDGRHMRPFLGGHDGECVARRLRAAGAADAVNVILRMLRHVEIDHM